MLHVLSRQMDSAPAVNIAQLALPQFREIGTLADIIVIKGPRSATVVPTMNESYISSAEAGPLCRSDAAATVRLIYERQ